MAGKKVKLFESAKQGYEVVPSGTSRLVKIGQERICLVRKNNSFLAFADACPHHGHPLNEGNLNFQNEIVCALHSYRFDLDTGDEAYGRCRSLPLYKVVVEENGVFLMI